MFTDTLDKSDAQKRYDDSVKAHTLFKRKAKLIELINSMNASEFSKVHAVIESDTSKLFSTYLKALSVERIQCFQEFALDYRLAVANFDTAVLSLDDQQVNTIATRLSLALVEFFEEDIFEKIDDLIYDEIVNESQNAQELSIDYCQ